MNKKLIKSKYKILMTQIENGSYFGNVDLANRVNVYRCGFCGKNTKTIDVDKGTTSFLISCPQCGELARSSLYRNIEPWGNPTHEWYRPSIEATMRLRDGDLDHVLRGGLQLRKKLV